MNNIIQNQRKEREVDFVTRNGAHITPTYSGLL